MNEFLERVPSDDEPPSDVERVVGDGQNEKLAELVVMLKAQQLFDHSRMENDPFRSPDDVTQYELMTEIFSYLRDKECEDKRDRRTLVYRRLVKNDGELIKDSQVIEYRESNNAIEALITCDRFPDSEVSIDILKRVEDFIDFHLEITRPSRP
jgi:hypothetical protein